MLDRNTGRGSPGAFRKHIERSHWQQLELELAEVECLFGLRWLAMRAFEINGICRPHVAQLGEKKNQLCRQDCGFGFGCFTISGKVAVEITSTGCRWRKSTPKA